jgi:hypothetical protein
MSKPLQASSNPQNNQLVLGYGRKEIAPRLPVPLAGIVTRKERLAAWIADPPEVSVTVFSDGDKRLAIVALDLLIIDKSLHRDISAIAKGQGCDAVIINASHTHSGPGGYVSGSFGTRYFMGRFRPALLQYLLDRTAKALQEAIGDLDLVKSIAHGTAEAPGLTMNRRLRGGPVDDTVSAVVFRRVKRSPVLLATVSGHPVASAFLTPAALSADIPGRIRHGLRERGMLPVLLPGALGGLNLLYPEMETSAESHLPLVANVALSALDRALQYATHVPSPWPLGASFEKLTFQRCRPPQSSGPLAQRTRSGLTSWIGSAYARMVATESIAVPVGILQAGPLAIAGMPADFGVSATLLLRERLLTQGSQCPFVLSHTNGYIGYLHLKHEALWSPDSEAGFHHYENAMSWYGPEAAERLIEAVLRAHREVKLQVT